MESIDDILKARDEELQRHLDLHSKAVVEVEKLQHSLATVTELKNQAVKDLSSRTVLADELQKKVDSLTLSLQSCVDAKNGASKECTASMSVKKLATAEADAKVFNQRLSKCRSQLSTASSEVAARGVALSQKQQQIDSLQDALTTTNAKRESLSSQIASRVKQIKDLEGIVKSKQSNIQALTNDLAAERDANSKSARTLTAKIRQLNWALRLVCIETNPGPAAQKRKVYIMCQHGRQRSKCKDCGGSSVCQHGRQRSQCKDCVGSSSDEGSMRKRDRVRV